jgi:hypothetical protein
VGSWDLGASGDWDLEHGETGDDDPDDEWDLGNAEPDE